MPKHGKRYNELVKSYDNQGTYTLEDAVMLCKKMATAKFDETVEMHFRLGIDPRQADQQIRTTIMFPHGVGKDVTVLVFAEGEDAAAARNAGADIIGDDEIIGRIQNEGWTEFDVAIAVPSMMPKVGRLGRVLGPRGLMPSPKSGTVAQADELDRIVKELKAGRIEFRNDRYGNLHVPIGRASFTEEQLVDNARALIELVEEFRPSSIKGIYMRRVTITSTMGPGIWVEA